MLGGDDTTGFLGVEYGPLNTGQTPKPGKKLEIRGLSLNGGVTLADLDRRQDLLKRFDHAFDSLGKDDQIFSRSLRPASCSGCAFHDPFRLGNVRGGVRSFARSRRPGHAALQ